MIAAFIFFLHIVAAIYAFTVNKKESIGEGFLAVAFVGIIFAVGWTIATMFTNFLFSFEFFDKWYWQPLDSRIWLSVRKEINRDAISLLVLTGSEIIFYYFYFFTNKESNNDKKN